MYYDKKIRYLSYYESGIKLQNAGYVKFQVREHICQMAILVKGPRLMGSGEAKVYLLTEGKEDRDIKSIYQGSEHNNLERRLLGNIAIRNGQGYCGVRLSADNMGDTGLRYDEVYGIRIELREYQYLESEWAVVNFMPWKPESRIVEQNTKEKIKWERQMPEEYRKPGYQSMDFRKAETTEEKTTETLNIEETAESERRKEENSSEIEGISMQDAVLMQEKISAQDTKVFQEEVLKQETAPEMETGMPRQETVPKTETGMPGQETAPKTETGTGRETAPETETGTGRETTPKKEMGMPEQTLEEEVLQGMEEAGIPELAEDMVEMHKTEQELKPDKWEQLRGTYPIVHPIREDEEYLKIEPKDFVIFTEKYQELVHNSFLLHGYYNYKHLILGKKERNGRMAYYLGVPGTFHEREKTVAVMFGFEAFDGKREPARNGDFGYYLRRVEL